MGIPCNSIGLELQPKGADREAAAVLVKNVAGFACLLGGMTVMALGCPGLTRAHRASWRYWRIRSIGIAVFAAAAAGFSSLVDPITQKHLVKALEFYPAWSVVLIGLGILALICASDVVGSVRPTRA